ncbi:MAG: hypothetical protein MRJ67_09705 [Nitrospirales bacterium]|nr:hypothetical protein [Nitrospirales bacterium]MDR4485033.1 hypothetical protein [Nitrospirales bacterium]
MLKLSGIVVLLFLSIFLVSCNHPFISVEVRTGGEIAPLPSPPPTPSDPDPTCFWPLFTCPGELNIGKVVKKEEAGEITFYRIQMGENYRNITAPPTVVDKTISEGNTVEISISEDGTMTMRKPS